MERYTLMSGPVLLDTCALIWLANGDPVSDAALARIREAEQQSEPIFVSPISAWEIGMLSAKGRIRLTSLPETWFKRAMSATAMRLQDLSVEILIRSTDLPGDPPADPADRMIVATAREHGLTVVTRDQQILNYAQAGYLEAMEC